MISILLVIIYVAFISLGLPDAILGSAWPSMYEGLNVPLASAGIISMIIAFGTIVSSLLSNKLIRSFGTGLITLVSVAMTAAALMGFSMSNSFWQLCVWGIPYGLGAGSVDAALNNFVALHYKSKHMSWLHCFWGIGATLGPSIMGMYLTSGFSWHRGYQTIGIMQIALVLVLFLSLRLWRVPAKETNTEAKNSVALSLRGAFRLQGAKAMLTAFFCYCALESTTGLWASSYLVLYKGITTQQAAAWASFFYFGITAGRFVGGFVSDKAGSHTMVRIGQMFIGLGFLLFFIPSQIMTLAALILIGLGCAPIFPSLLHATPDNFGAENSQALMGMQMACAYTGTTLMPPLLGFLAQRISISLYPFFILFFVVLMFIMTEKMNKIRRRKARVE